MVPVATIKRKFIGFSKANNRTIKHCVDSFITMFCKNYVLAKENVNYSMRDFFTDFDYVMKFL